VIAVVVLALAPPPAHADVKQPVFDQSPIARAALVSDVATIEPGTPFRVALRLVLPGGWHTYWLNPGESGAPTTLRWRLPDGFIAGPILWPAPERIDFHDVVNFGYHDEVWLFSDIVPPADLQPGADVRLMVDAEWAVCSDVCVPEVATLTLWMDVGGDGRAAAPWAVAFDAEARRLPAAAPATLSVDESHVTLDLDVSRRDVPVDGEPFFFAAPFGVIEPGAPQRWSRTGDTVSVIAERPASGTLPPDGRVAGVVVFQTETDRRAFAVDAPIENQRSAQ
jgi:DsbC/DsbD-like thiol-disulfide interchange protein